MIRYYFMITIPRRKREYKLSVDYLEKMLEALLKFEMLALNYCRKSMLISEKSEKYFEYALVLSNLGVIWYHKNAYDKALQYWEQSVSLCIREKYKDIADNSELFGNICQHFNEKTLAYNCYVKALKPFTRFKRREDMKRVYTSLMLINMK
ncbi:unnamed protein product [Didymodactylos carnosus]|uniref:Tetratricopeptide repeat protein n=1 Tax=Didymodactylos carnosus TaxID=1234261 RepID=A0A814WCK4_9BILA|nr:unnamed protein product [Didymodactylos carnosus]CAF3964156.1 unnamed protein product [Didymodactylos carnosus]